VLLLCGESNSNWNRQLCRIRRLLFTTDAGTDTDTEESKGCADIVIVDSDSDSLRVVLVRSERLPQRERERKYRTRRLDYSYDNDTIRHVVPYLRVRVSTRSARGGEMRRDLVSILITRTMIGVLTPFATNERMTQHQRTQRTRGRHHWIERSRFMRIAVRIGTSTRASHKSQIGTCPAHLYSSNSGSSCSRWTQRAKPPPQILPFDPSVSFAKEQIGRGHTPPNTPVIEKTTQDTKKTFCVRVDYYH
jgi:hypothetical protein